MPDFPLPGAALREAFGDIDIYLFDQLLRGRFDRRTRVLDAGCGEGRNLVYLMKQGFMCFGIDQNPSAIALLRGRAETMTSPSPAQNFVVGDLERLPWPDASMDAVISSAVLHFVADEDQFGRSVEELWRVLAPGGLFFARLASNIGLEHQIGTGGRRARLPDGSERFVVDESMLLAWTRRLGAQLLDPIKTTNVQQLRCMTTWCLSKA
jgi:SAM-dependent methyltransferase